VTRTDEPYLVVLNSVIDMDAGGTSSPSGGLTFAWNGAGGISGPSSALTWTPHQAETRGTLAVTDACGKVATKNLYFLAP
jgi:hypothetical protein